MRDSLSVLCTVLAVLQCIDAESGSVECHTSRGLRTEAPDDSRCSQSGPCLSEHPPHDEQQQCQELYPHVEPAAMPSYVQECPKEAPYYSRCNELVNHTVSDKQFFLITSVCSELLSLDPQHFAVNVSWDYRDAVKASTEPPPSKQLRGYEVRIRQNDALVPIVGCWCISDRNVSSIAIGTGGLNPRFQYRASTTMRVEVLTLPYDPQYVEAEYLTFQSRDWPSECNDRSVMRTPESCTPPLLPSPWNVRVNSTRTGDSTKDLAVTWSHSSPAPPPHIYYVYGASDQGNFSVVVNGTKQVTVTGLNTSGTYTVRVQGYSPCAGISAFLSSVVDLGIGCGGLSDGVPEPPDPPLPITPEHAANTTQPPLQVPYHPVSLLLALLLSALVVLVTALTAMFVLLGVLVYRRNRKSRSQTTCIIADPVWGTNYKYTPVKVKPDVLVLYSLKTPSSEQELVERCVVAELKRHYHVNSCNDHTEKTVMEWVDEQTRHAHSVLIICNKSFHSEWNSRGRGRLLNSLNAIINSAASHENLSKFATVLLQSDSNQYIPDNQYIQGMTSFVVDVDDEYAGVEDILTFLKLNSKTQR